MRLTKEIKTGMVIGGIIGIIITYFNFIIPAHLLLATIKSLTSFAFANVTSSHYYIFNTIIGSLLGALIGYFISKR